MDIEKVLLAWKTDINYLTEVGTNEGEVLEIAMTEEQKKTILIRMLPKEEAQYLTRYYHLYDTFEDMEKELKAQIEREGTSGKAKECMQ